MSMLQREISRIRATLLGTEQGATYERLYAAQHALAWASDPEAFKAPYDHPENRRSRDFCYEPVHRFRARARGKALDGEALAKTGLSLLVESEPRQCPDFRDSLEERP